MLSSKHLVAAAIVLASSLTLQGCGGGGDDPAPGPGPTPGPAGPTPAPATYPPTPAPPPNPWCKTAGPPAPAPPVGTKIGWNPTGEAEKESSGKWCEVRVPDPSWKLDNFCTPPTPGVTVQGDGLSVSKERFLSTANSSTTANHARLKVLTYNLYWWNLFGPKPKGREGADGIAGKNMAKFAKDVPYDLIGFQECEDITWPLKDAKAAGMTDEFVTFPYKMAVALAYRKSVFEELSRGGGEVGEDRADQHYGRREVQYVRLKHKASGKTVFFINHHGPTPVNTGGLCGPSGTAYNILKVIGENAMVGDHVVLTGDFNNWSNGPDGKILEEIGAISCHLPHIFSNPKVEDVWGIDNIFASCARTIETTVMERGGSDHFALNVVIDI